MPNLKDYRLFIGHSWAYGDAYEKLVKFFNEHPNFTWSNYSVPQNDPIYTAVNDNEQFKTLNWRDLKGIFNCCGKLDRDAF